MKNSLKKIVYNLKQEKNKKEHLQEYVNTLSTDYYQYSLIALSMNYYVLCESLMDNSEEFMDDLVNETLSKEEMNENIHSLMEEIHHIVEKGILNPVSNEQRKELLEQIQMIRNTIIDRVDVLSDLVEKALIVEYVINRLEYRFDVSKSEIMDKEIDDYLTSSDIMEFIFSQNDLMVINEKIRQIIGQLPVRMAKSKFLDVVGNCFSLYKDSDQSAMESFLYLLKSCSMLYEPKGSNLYFTEIKEELRNLEAMETEDITAEQFYNVKERFTVITRKIGMYTDTYTFIQELVNRVYIVLLLEEYTVKDEMDMESLERAKLIMEDVQACFRTNDSKELEKTDANLVLLEGAQEAAYESANAFEAGLFHLVEEYENDIKDANLTEEFNALKKVRILASSSLFAQPELSEEEKIMDENWFQEAKGQFLLELSNKLTQVSRPIKRAIMANIFKMLPVYFQNKNELQEYIENSLTSCKDKAEKNASLDLIKSIMYEEVDWD